MIKPSHIGSGVMALLAVIIIAAKPLSANLSDTAQTILGCTLITLGIWIFKPFNMPYSAGGMLLSALALILRISPTVVFSGFTQPAVWTLISALLFGYTLQKTGLGKRIAMAIISLVKPTYLSLVLALVLIGVILSLLTPSIAVRIAIVVPIAVQCCELCKIEKGSKGNSLLLLTALSMAIIPGSAWQTGALWGPIITGMINSVPETRGLVTFDSWLKVAFMPIMLTSTILIVASLLVMKPKEKLSKDSIDGIRKQPTEKMSRQEIITAVILTVVFLLFLTSRIHGLPDAAICLAGVFAFFLSGGLDVKDWGVGVTWDTVIFTATALSLGAIFTETGISGWLAGIVVPAIAPIAGNPWSFVFGAMIFLFIWRFFDVAALLPTLAILTPILPAIQDTYGISPLVWITIFVMAGNCFFMAYQSMFAMMGLSVAGDRAWGSKHLGIYGALYSASCLISLAITIPQWINAGLFK